MQIKVNDNIDKYKDEFFKGFSAKETFVALTVVVVYLACYAIMDFVLYIPQILSLYLALPLPLVIGLLGFLALNGHDFLGAMIAKRKMKEKPDYNFYPKELDYEQDMFYPEKAMPKKRKRDPKTNVIIRTEEEEVDSIWDY